MSLRHLLLVAVVATLVTLLGVLALDAPLAQALGSEAGATPTADTLAATIRALDRVTAMTWPRKEQLASVLIVAGGALWWWRRRLGHALLLVGLTHAVSRTLGGELKPLFGRLRPSEALASDHVGDSFWWERGIAFPSGHVAHYAALAFTVSFLFPRARIPALAVLAFVIVARVGVNAHFLSDAAASVAIAALACAGAAAALAIMERRRGPGAAWFRRPGRTPP